MIFYFKNEGLSAFYAAAGFTVFVYEKCDGAEYTRYFYSYFRGDICYFANSRDGGQFCVFIL